MRWMILLAASCATAPSDDDGITLDDDSTGTHTAGPALVFEGAKPKNLLMISLDTVRRDQVGWFTGLDTTPNLDALMAQSVVLEDHRSCSNWTAPSVLCVLLGYNPVDQGWWPTQLQEQYGGDPDVPWIPDDIHPLAEPLSDAGYNTLLLTSNEVYSDRVGGGMANGFQEVRLPLQLPAPDVAEKAILAASEMLADGRPWFLAVHFIDPHAPFKAPVEYATDADALGPFAYELDDQSAYLTIEDEWTSLTDTEQEQALNYMLTIYRAEYRYWDDHFGQMWTDLDDMGFLDDTLVVFWTDHGEQFHDHGAWHHGVGMFEEENRSVAFLWSKNLTPRTWTGATIHQDLAPTVLDILDFEPNADHTGIRLGDAPDDRTFLTFNYIYGWGYPKSAYLAGNYKLVYNWVGEKFLHNLAIDPGEEDNLHDAADPVTLAMWDVLLPEIERIQEQWPTLTPVDPGP